MADDIDIEEHDLLDHPQVAGICLQYPNIKSEPVEYEDTYEEYSGAIYDDSLPIKNEPMDCDTEQTQHIEHPIAITTSQTIPQNETANVQTENLQSNRIILGKKPCPRYRPGPKRRKLKTLLIMLEDWGERLNTSPCFCKECQTLFATRNAIDAHNMAAHSFLVPFENPQTPESLKKGDSPLPNQPNHRFCTHCNTHFADDNLLIQHLYDLIQAKQKSKEPHKAKEVKSLNTNIVGAKKVDVKPLTTNVSKQIKEIKTLNVGAHKQTKEIETSNVGAHKQAKEIKTSNVGTYKQRIEITSNLSNGESSEDKKETYLCCQLCFCYFKSRWEFNGHCARSHGPCEAVEEVIDGKFSCKFCESLHKMSMSLNRHIRINHHKEVNNLLAVKKNRVIVNEAKYLTNTKLKCFQCNLHFKDMNLAKIHQRNYHGDRNKIVVLKKGLSMPKMKKSFLPSKVRNLDRGLPMPKNVIFKCNKCPLHFLNCLTVCCHVSTKHYNAKKSSKDKVVDGWKCLDCNRTFRAMDMHLHELQHKQTREFKVYVAHDKIYSRVLCRCATCNIYFEERAFMKHTKSGCGPTADVNICNTCNIKVNNSTIHVEKHVTRKLIKSDFIIIDDFIPTKIGVENKNKMIIGSKPDLKRKREEGESSQTIPNKKVTLALKTTTQSELKHIEQVKDTPIFYYCSHCRLYCIKTDRRRYHIMKKCIYQNLCLRMCTFCGLRFTSFKQLDNHRQQHQQKNFSIKNFRFVCIKTMKICTPPLPEFNKCKTCGIQFLRRHEHKCKNISKSITCKLCKKSYSSKAFALHVLHHKYFGKPAQAPNKSLENTLRMKYEMLKPTWNILYICESCDVTTDSYDDVVDHCQNHYNDMQSFDVTIKNCEQCSLNFEEKCYNKHQELHSNQEIGRSSFTILKYDYTKLLTDAWFEIFNSLPSEKMMQILKRTIYATRLVKMKLLQSGPPEYTIYKCQKCEEIVARDEISIHTNARSCRKQPPKHTCMHCGLAFANTRALDAHISIHEQHVVTVNSFRIVAFNHLDEIAFNAKLRSECSISEIVPQQNISNTPEERYKCIYYRCEKCYCCTSKFRNTVRHVCPVEKDTRLCHKCNNVFHRSGIILHNRKHDNTVMTADDIVVKPFNANIKPGEWRVDLTECQNCNAKFPTHLLNTHQCRSKATNSIPTVTLYRCKTCKALFSFKEILEKHSKTCNTGRRKCIFKCKKCSRFMLSRGAVHYHTSEDSEDKAVIKPCKYCGWMFTPWSLQKHIKLHHQSLKLTPNDFCIEVIDTHCGALANDNKKEKKQPINVPKDNIKPVVIKKAKEASVESNIHGIKPVIKKYKSRKERLMDRTLKKETNTKNGDAHVKINVNKDIEDDQKVEQKKSSSESNKKARHNPTQYDKMKNSLFRCAKCELHYLNYRTWISHIQLKHKVSRGADICTICGLKFTLSSLKRHVLMHQGGATPHYDVVTPDERLAHVLKPTKVKDSNNDTLNAKDSVVSQSGTDSDQSLVEDSSVLQTQMLKDSSVDQTQNKKPSPQPEETMPQTKKSPPTLNNAATKKYSHKIYKCGQCNVHFMAQNTCYIHMLRHTPIEAKEFIECKLCNLPFKIVSLNTHMRKHHKENFNLDEVLVEEYKNDGGKTPKIEIYYAIDKVQSRLVSTTSDEPNLERDIESNSQPSSSSSNAQTNDDVVETSQADTSDVTMDTQPSVSSETLNENTDKIEDVSLIDKEERTNDDVVETSQGDTSDVTMDTQPSVSSETVEDKTDKIEDVSLIDKEERTNDDVVATSQGDTSDVTMDKQPSVSSETVEDKTDKIEDVSLIDKEERTNDDVVETSQGDTSDVTMDTQPSVSSETVEDKTDKIEDVSLIDKEERTNDDVVETSQGDTSDVTMDTQPSVSSETVEDKTDKIEDTNLIVKEERTNDDVVATSQGDTSDVTMDTQPSVSSETVDDKTDKIEDINLIEKEENVIKIHKCQFCGEQFKSNTSKEFHESLDHLDGEKNCMICDKTFNASILNELHLSINNNTFGCCLCKERFDVQEMASHAEEH